MDGVQSATLKQWSSLWRELDEVYHEIALKIGLSDSAFLVLYGICEIGAGCLQKDICTVYSISKQTVHSSIRNLMKENYLRLEKGGRLFLTPAGEQLVKEKIFPVIEAENASFSAMVPEEREELIRLTQTYLQLLRKKTWQMLSLPLEGLWPQP